MSLRSHKLYRALLARKIHAYNSMTIRWLKFIAVMCPRARYVPDKLLSTRKKTVKKVYCIYDTFLRYSINSKQSLSSACEGSMPGNIARWVPRCTLDLESARDGCRRHRQGVVAIVLKRWHHFPVRAARVSKPSFQGLRDTLRLRMDQTSRSVPLKVYSPCTMNIGALKGRLDDGVSWSLQYWKFVAGLGCCVRHLSTH